MIEFFHLENQQPTEKNNMSQFGPTSVPHCGGRACVRCGKCRLIIHLASSFESGDQLEIFGRK
jgi:hypothetical protein